jgi:hypothetical protein
MTITRRIATATAALALAASTTAASTAAATTAAATTAAATTTAPASPHVGPQRTWTGATAPLTIPGTGLHRGERIPRGERIVYRDVTVAGREVVDFALRAPAGTKIRAVAPDDPPAPPEVDFLVTNVRPRGQHTADRYYPGGTLATIRARARPAGSGAVTERIYALAG